MSRSPSRRWWVGGAAMLALVSTGPLAAQAPPGAAVDSAVGVLMRDGVILRATVWRPAGPGRVPVLVYRTPYDRTEIPALAAHAVERGYAVVLQDVRGRYGSEGDFDPYRNEGRDGFDTIEWAARQPWSNGNVGTFGLSYPGAVQWLAAKERPPALRAMVPAMTYATPENFWFSGGVWDGSWLDWTWYNIAPDLRVRSGQPGPRTAAEIQAQADTAMPRMRAHRPLSTLPDFRSIAPWYYKWMRHPPSDPWWNWATLSGHYRGLRAEVLNLSGWFDEPYGPIGAVTNYAAMVAAARRDHTGLILGPWTHGGQHQTRAGDRDFGPDARIDYSDTVLDWLDRTLRPDSSSPAAPPVRVFVMGANRWRSLPGWPPPGSRATSLWLTGVGRGDPGHGTLEWKPVRQRIESSTFRSDPARPLTDPFQGAAGPHDYRALAGRQDLLLFETEPLSEPLEIIGPVVAELQVSATVPDFDVWIQLFDVGPDGTAWNLAGYGAGLQRASYRFGGPGRELPPIGKPVTLRLDRMLTANRFLAGHRIRLLVAGAFMPLFSSNPQTGELEFDSPELGAGDITVHHSAARPSRLILPVTPPSP